jgi:hypothetical protein
MLRPEDGAFVYCSVFIVDFDLSTIESITDVLISSVNNAFIYALNEHLNRRNVFGKCLFEIVAHVFSSYDSVMLNQFPVVYLTRRNASYLWG